MNIILQCLDMAFLTITLVKLTFMALKLYDKVQEEEECIYKILYFSVT